MIAVATHENLPRMYGNINYNGKSVLDVGADWGTTAYYFLNKGAREVFAIEGNKIRFDKLMQNINGDPRVSAYFCMIDSEQKAAQYIHYLYPNIVKIDCEGCEKHFVEVNDSTFSIPEIYVVETHNWKMLTKFKKKFAENGYVIVKEIITHVSFLPFRVLTATRV